MDLLDIEQAALEQYSCRDHRLKLISRLFTDSLDALVRDYASRLELAQEGAVVRAVFQDLGGANYLTALNMEQCAFRDLQELIKLERDASNKKITRKRLDSGMRQEEALITQVFDPTGELEIALIDIVQRYPGRLYTLIDNLHYVVAAFCSLEFKLTEGERERICDQLKGVNSRLKRHLASSFKFSRTYQEFDSFRTDATHYYPNFTTLVSGVGPGDCPVRYQFAFQFPNGRQEDAFEHLFTFYKYVLERTLGAINLMLQAPPTTKYISQTEAP